ncbi:rhodanese-like domain-containing protein [Dietzia sp. 111N12-1]|uniref:MBL fold metallo-hydrolase n=1 Tax=Dietzia sp. 111N12-1 TaxID=1785156 RepID=UPI0008048799|nr:MBL fold metallo-hydrolase [Dietzia sp. 111N12-1]OAV76772.1 Zn-dependent hydrolase [Dietzia sp. 111N12-1]
MLFERIYDYDLAHASYFIGCQSSSEAIVVDPSRDLRAYFDMADQHGMSIVKVTETHIHADYLSGTRELAAATGATVYLSDEGGDDWRYGFSGERLRDGDTIELGNVQLKAVHTPGHTPEHLMFLVTDGAFADEPGYALTGDFVFCGDLGRPDLLDEAAGGSDSDGEETRFESAKQLFASLRERFLTLPDHVQVFPAHGAGSACGKSLGALPSSSVGYERKFAWWPTYVENDDEEGFISELLDGQPDAPAYFGRMKRENRDGPSVLGNPLPELRELPAEEVASGIESGDLVVVDPRPADDVHDGTVDRAINLPAGQAGTYAGWAIDPEKDTRGLVFLAEDAEEADELRRHVIRVGVDTTRGYVTSTDGLPTFRPETVDPKDLESHEHAMVLDVRATSEYSDGHVPDATQLHGGQVMWERDELPDSGKIVTYCQSGTRSSVVASSLRSVGYDVTELEGSYSAWEDAGMPTE